nr:ninein isoform X2 [Doryrhamphus excisus]
MDDVQEQDHYEERLKELFSSFDASGCGSLRPEELADLCLSLHLDDVTPALLDSLLHDRDRLTARVDFHQFKDALILVLSSGMEAPQAEQDPPEPRPESPEIQPKFVKGGKRYGRRSTPEFIHAISDSCEDDTHADHRSRGGDAKDSCDSAIPRKRERWNADERNTEEYEAEGQMHLWNPDETNTPRASAPAPHSEHLEARLEEACQDLAIAWDGCAGRADLLALCDYLGVEMSADVVQSLNGDSWMNVQEFVSTVLIHSKPATPSASTPYRQLKRHHSTQPFDEVGRRIATPSALMSTIGTRLFSSLDDGTGFIPVESVMDAWTEEGVENGTEILQALNFSLDGKLSLCDLAAALENELLATKNGVHHAALASFKAEIRHLLERVDGELREKEKLRSDLEKAERLKNQLATEVDEHHSSIEDTNNLNLRKLEQDHREKLAAVRSEMMEEMDQIRQQAAQQREELEAKMEKIKDDESFLRDHLSISVKENRRLEVELLDCSEKLLETEGQVAKLRASLDSIMKEKFGDVESGSGDFFLQEERMKQLRLSYEAQCRELQDRVDELQSEVRDFNSLGPHGPHQPCHKPLSEELESKSPAMESDPGLGSEEVHPFSVSLEAEMMLEQQKEQHLQQMERLRTQLEGQISEFKATLEEQRAAHQDQKDVLALKYQQEVRALREELDGTRELQSQLEQAELERTRSEQQQAGEVNALRRQLLEAQTHAGELEEQLSNLQGQPLLPEMEELRKQHGGEMKTLEKKNMEVLESRLKEERNKHQEEKDALKKSWLDGFEKEKQLLRESHEVALRTRLEEERSIFEEEQSRTVQKLTEEWQKERAQLDEQNNEALQTLLEEEMLRLLREQEEKESQWESERAHLVRQQEEALIKRVEEHERKLKREQEEERLQLEDDYEGMLQERLDEEREKHRAEKEEMEERLRALMDVEKERQEDIHRNALQELTLKHAEERSTLGGLLDKLRDDIAQERQHMEVSFSQKIKEIERRFSGDQESVAERFRADVETLERHYQIQLQQLSESHAQQKLHWEAQMQRALGGAEEQRLELERVHEEFLEAMAKKNQALQHDMENIRRTSQTKEMEMSCQLKDLHNQLQESLQANRQLLAQSDEEAAEVKLLLSQTVEDFQQEREDLLNSRSQLETKYKEMLSISERQTAERIQLLTERDDLKLRMEEMEKLLRQAADDFDVDRKELQEHVLILEEKLKGIHAQDVENNDMRKVWFVSCPRQAIREDTVMEMDALGEPSVVVLDIAQEPCEERDPVMLEASQNQVQISDLSHSWTEKDLMCNDPEASAIEEPEDGPEGCLVTREEDSEMTTCKAEDPGTDEDKKKASSYREFQCEDSDRRLCEDSEEHEPSPSSAKPSHEDKRDSWDDTEEPVGQDVVYELQASYHQARDENVLLQEKISLLQQKTELLQSLLEHNNKKILTGHEYLEENYSLKVKMFLLLEHIKVLEMKALKVKELQALRDDCLRENVQLKEQNGELKKRIQSLERNTSPGFHDGQMSLLDEINMMREENCKLAGLFREFDMSPGSPGGSWESCSSEDDICDLEVNTTPPHLQDISELQGKDAANRATAASLADENVSLKHRISSLEEDDLKQAREDLTHTLGQLNREKVSAGQAAEEFNKQISDLRSQSRHLQSENETLADKNTRSLADVEMLKMQLAQMMKDSERKEVLAVEEKKELASCVRSLEAELTKALKDTARLEDRNSQLAKQASELQEKVAEADSIGSHLDHLTEERKDADKERRILRKQLAKAQEKVKTTDETLQTLGHERACLKSELRMVQQDRDALLQEVAALHKKLQNANNKVRTDSGGILSHRQQRHLSVIKALEQENASLRQEVDTQKLVIKDLAAREGLAQVEKLREENQVLKDQVERLTAQLLESFQAHFAGLLPSSPCRMARRHGPESDADDGQDARQRRMERMEERMKEIEVSLRNVKLLLREKVAQLKEQVHKNSIADVLIRDLYSENGQLLKALEMSKQRRRKMEGTARLAPSDVNKVCV